MEFDIPAAEVALVLPGNQLNLVGLHMDSTTKTFIMPAQ